MYTLVLSFVAHLKTAIQFPEATNFILESLIALALAYHNHLSKGYKDKPSITTVNGIQIPRPVVLYAAATFNHSCSLLVRF